MKLSLNAAAKHYKVSKSTLSEALNNGRLSAKKDSRGRWQIDPSEMDRVFPLNSTERTKDRNPNAYSNTENHTEIIRLKAELDAEKRLRERAEGEVSDLRDRLDGETEERRKLTAMLTDQRAGEATKSKKWFWQKSA